MSSVHNLLFQYNHCRYDEEERVRFYRARDLNKLSCHDFQFQVWRYSGQSRHLISSVTLFIFYGFFHYMLVTQMSRVLYFWDHQETINYWTNRAKLQELAPAELALT